MRTHHPNKTSVDLQAHTSPHTLLPILFAAYNTLLHQTPNVDAEVTQSITCYRLLPVNGSGIDIDYTYIGNIKRRAFARRIQSRTRLYTHVIPHRSTHLLAPTQIRFDKLLQITA